MELLPLMQRRELKYSSLVQSARCCRCLSCRGVNWNLCVTSEHFCPVMLPLMQRRELKFLARSIVSFGTLLPLMQRRELKLAESGTRTTAAAWLPLMQRRELKYWLCFWLAKLYRLPLMQRRELKWLSEKISMWIISLPLMQRRELKYILLRLLHSYFRCVASHAEAWIEMLLLILLRVLPECCLSCRGVNWNRSRWPHKIQKSYVASHAEAWIEIWLLLRLRPSPICCLSCRGVNWNIDAEPEAPKLSVASHAEAWIEIGLTDMYLQL